MRKALVPMRKGKLYTKQIGLKVTPDLFEDIATLKGLGVDVATLNREAIERAVADALKEKAG